MTLPQSAIYALGLACVLAPANVDPENREQPLSLPRSDQYIRGRSLVGQSGVRKEDHGFRDTDPSEDRLLERLARKSGLN